MKEFKPIDLVLRCYGYRFRSEPFTGVCLDLNIAVQADSPLELRTKMSNAITSYINTVLDTKDRESIPQLIRRRAPMRDWIIYYLIRSVLFIKEFRDRLTFFNEHIPFHLANNC